MDLGESVLCRCRPGFGGPDCNINVDDCASAPCQNAGTCIDGINDYVCRCTLGFSGKNCSVRADACLVHQCQHGGTCYTHFSGPVCQCPPGFMGPSCEFPVRPTFERAYWRSPSSSSSSSGLSPAALAASVILGIMAFGLAVCAVILHRRKRTKQIKRQQLCDSVFNDLESDNINNYGSPYPDERGNFLGHGVGGGSPVKVSNTSSRLSLPYCPAVADRVSADFVWSSTAVGMGLR